MRALLVIGLGLGALGCVAPAESSRTCGDMKPAQAVLVLERESSGQSGLGLLGTDGCLTETPDVALGTDPILCPAHDRPFVCVRDEGLVLEIDPADARVLRTMKAYRDGEAGSCGAAICSNPHGVDVDATGRLWVARYDQASMAVLGPTGAFAQAVDLATLAGATGLPQMEAVRVHDGRAFVALQRLPALDCVPGGVAPGTIAVVDVAAPAAAPATFALQGRNPLGRFVPAGSDPTGATVSIATPGSFADATSATDGVELVDLATRTSRVAVSEQALGGSVVEAVVAGPTEAYAIVAEADPDCRTARNATFLVRFDPASGGGVTVLADTRATADPGFYFAGLAVVGDRVVVGDRTPGAPRLRFFDRASGAVVGEITPQRLPPAGLLALP